MATIIDSIGNTPLVEIRNFHRNPRVQLLAKLEGTNPGGSVKDRAALSMIQSALDRGDITRDSQLIEATSGNTGIALAMIASMFGLSIELVMPASSTRERVLTMQAFGAKVTLLDDMEVSRDYAEDKAKSGDYFLLNQFGNEDNYKAHYRGTAPEIWRDTEGQITHFVSAMGTTGTIMGCSRFLKDQNSEIEIIGCQPTDGSSIPGIRRWPEAYLPKIFEPSRIDRTIDVDQQDAKIMTQQLARQAGVFAGMSSGGACHAAVKVANEIDSGVVVFIVCDRGDRYLSSDLFE